MLFYILDERIVRFIKNNKMRETGWSLSTAGVES